MVPRACAPADVLAGSPTAGSGGPYARAMTDITGIVNLALLVGVIGVVISLLGKVERIATALEELAEDRRRAPADDGSSHRSEPDAG